ncbi:hypothetical protein COU61_03815 [Candidatus Pacearchaeota archaeon CG10_big_fil_rev_8_21_14_0_10_35_13]|nr:MAG: hypothetical protein COU61_03815 [Candidatus Pacearchaeota archaeon CG10_big_fil_rev_8_21_14_0_10_35_13]
MKEYEKNYERAVNDYLYNPGAEGTLGRLCDATEAHVAGSLRHLCRTEIVVVIEGLEELREKTTGPSGKVLELLLDNYRGILMVTGGMR